MFDQTSNKESTHNAFRVLPLKLCSDVAQFRFLIGCFFPLGLVMFAEVAKRSNICLETKCWMEMFDLDQTSESIQIQCWERRLNGQTCSSNTTFDENVWSFSRCFTKRSLKHIQQQTTWWIFITWAITWKSDTLFFLYRALVSQRRISKPYNKSILCLC